MKKTPLLISLITVLALTILPLLTVGTTYAATCKVEDKKNNVTHTFTTNILPCNDSDPGNLLIDVVNFLAIGVGIAVLAGIVYGAFLYASSGGSAEQTKKGIGYVRNAVIALVLFIFMYAIINFLVPGGLF